MSEVRLNLGCGTNVAPGWINIDRSPGLVLERVKPLKWVLWRVGVLSEGHMIAWPREIVMADLRKRLDYPDRGVDAIYSSHTLEHLYFDDAQALLRECHRVLRPSRILRLALPDAEQFARDLLNGVHGQSSNPGLEYNRMLNMCRFDRPSWRQRLAGLFGSALHRWQPTFSMVEMMLRDVGFAEVRRCEYKVGQLPDLDLVEHRPESFFIEATRTHAHRDRAGREHVRASS
jgi:SAM-dependent methyltransferase